MLICLKNNYSQIASIAATRVESMRDLLIRSVYISTSHQDHHHHPHHRHHNHHQHLVHQVGGDYHHITIIILIITIIIINILVTRWEEMSISGEKDTMDFQPLTQFLKCYAIYFAS